jgi:transglutaminase-like putative cysteine protease
MEQSFTYTYPGPIRDLHQRLIVIPPDQHGDQRLIDYELQATSPLAKQTVEYDSFGNRIIRYFVPYVDERVSFDMKLVIERNFTAPTLPQVTAGEAARFRAATHLTEADQRIKRQARSLLALYPEVEHFGSALNTWVHATMKYGRGATTVFTTAAEAMHIRQGLCQDYAHIMLAICRAAGIAARYVSGHLLGVGRSHAWVELLLPNTNGSYRARAFDPTNHRRTTPAYLTIAVGRDYSDVSPTSGTFTAPYPGHLRATKRAGIIGLVRRPHTSR